VHFKEIEKGNYYGWRDIHMAAVDGKMQGASKNGKECQESSHGFAGGWTLYLRLVSVASDEIPLPWRFKQPDRFRLKSPVSAESGASAFFSRIPLQCCSLNDVSDRSDATGSSLDKHRTAMSSHDELIPVTRFARIGFHPSCQKG
jgi:hypothetical protein